MSRGSGFLLVLSGVVCFAGGAAMDSTQLGKRSPWPVPLARLSIALNQATGDFEKVKISFDDEVDYAIITRFEDLYVKVTPKGQEKAVYGESFDRAFEISDFEAQELGRVNKSFIATLKQFEINLQKGKWDRCLYLDGLLPRFLKGFYYLYSASRNSFSAMPRQGCVGDDLFDASLSSPKSDQRIEQWLSRNDYIIKLRIITKELIYQLEEWQNKELENPKRNRDQSYSGKLEEAFTLFVKFYFNLQSATPNATHRP